MHEKPLVGKNYRLNSSSRGHTKNYGFSDVFSANQHKTYAFYGVYTWFGECRMHLIWHCHWHIIRRLFFHNNELQRHTSSMILPLFVQLPVCTDTLLILYIYFIVPRSPVFDPLSLSLHTLRQPSRRLIELTTWVISPFTLTYTWSAVYSLRTTIVLLFPTVNLNFLFLHILLNYFNKHWSH